LDNLHIANDTSVKEALVEFCNYCVNLDEQLEYYQQHWLKILLGILSMLKKARPDVQIILLRILLELCRKETNIQIIKDNGGFKSIIDIVKSINDDLNGEGLLVFCDNLY
jgi:hypothetical protein